MSRSTTSCMSAKPARRNFIARICSDSTSSSRTPPRLACGSSFWRTPARRKRRQPSFLPRTHRLHRPQIRCPIHPACSILVKSSRNSSPHFILSLLSFLIFCHSFSLILYHYHIYCIRRSLYIYTTTYLPRYWRHGERFLLFRLLLFLLVASLLLLYIAYIPSFLFLKLNTPATI